MRIKEINPKMYSAFHVTGVYAHSNRRFRPQIYTGNLRGLMTAMSINLWRGSVWGILKETGKRQLLKTVSN